MIGCDRVKKNRKKDASSLLTEMDTTQPPTYTSSQKLNGVFS